MSGSGLGWSEKRARQRTEEPSSEIGGSAAYGQTVSHDFCISSGRGVSEHRFTRGAAQMDDMALMVVARK
jgi:hypothetical protein